MTDHTTSRTVELCSITGAHSWRDDECTTCGARIRRDLPTRQQLREFQARNVKRPVDGRRTELTAEQQRDAAFARQVAAVRGAL